MEIVLEHVSKSYQDRHTVKRAVEDVSLRFTSGVWGLLGANGAGKTTLMRMICGIMNLPEDVSVMTGWKSDSWETLTAA